jgi:NAD(P)-dependent dehydrogenase (short-subunit alcohol dehydrogenase family)
MMLRDKVVIVTGVGPGMGRKLALLVAREGGKVVIAARTRDFLARVSNEIREAGGAVEAVPTDVTDPEACKVLAAAAVKAFGGIDGLVNSAFTHDVAPIEEADLSKWRAVMEVNCFGAVQMAQAVIPHMRARGGGSIVNVGTMGMRKVLPGLGAYWITKTALLATTRQLALELGKYKIRANMTLMGWMWGVPVEMLIKQMAKSRAVSEQTVIDEVVKNIPLGVIPSDEECAKAIVFFLSDYASAVTGASLDVNGGEYMAP